MKKSLSHTRVSVKLRKAEFRKDRVISGYIQKRWQATASARVCQPYYNHSDMGQKQNCKNSF